MLKDIAPKEEFVDVWQGKVQLKVEIRGSGSPLIYLPPADGIAWTPFLLALSNHYTVYVPKFPGTIRERTNDVNSIDDLWDLTLVYEEALRTLGVDRPILVGSSFGGLLAAELAANFPDRFSRLVLLAPLGLWRDDFPIKNLTLASSEDAQKLPYFNPEAEEVTQHLALPIDTDAARVERAARIWATGCASTFIWPIPDKGLRKRLHRIASPTLIMWGADDLIASHEYAKEFADNIRGSTVVIVQGAGHYLHVEQVETGCESILKFLKPSESLGIDRSKTRS